MRVFFLTSLFLAISLAAWAQKAVIYGTVTDQESGETLPGVNIVAGDNLGTVTDLDGYYRIELEPGTYNIIFRFVGYEERYKKIKVEAGDSMELNMVMATETKDIGLVTVTGSKYKKKIGEEVISIEVLTPEFISNSATTSIDKALDKVPGVNMLGEQINIRGGTGYAAGSSSRVLMLMDGLPLLKPDNGTIEFGSLPMENIQQIEVIKGASSALYGSSALNGIVNLITANPGSEPYTKLTMLYGFYENPFHGKQKDLIWWCGDRRPFFGGFNFGHRRRFDQVDLVVGGNYFEDGNYLYGAKIRRVNANIKVKYRPKNNPGLIMGLNTNFSSQAGGFFFLWKGWGETPKGDISPNTCNYVDSLITYISAGGSIPKNIRDSVPRAAWAYIPAEVTTFRSIPISFDPYLTYFDKKQNMHSIKGRVYLTYYENSNGEKSKSNIAYGEYNFHSALKKYGLNFVTGVASSYTWIDSETFGRPNAVNAAAFLQIDKKFFDRLTLNLGVRSEYFRLDTLSPVVKPIVRTGFNLQIAEATYLRGSYGQGYRYPAISEKFVRTQRSGVDVLPNPDVQPESSWSAELGIKQGLKLSKDWIGYFDVAGFITQYENMIEFIVVPAPPGEVGIFTQAQNVSNARISGVEMSVFGQGKIFGYPTNILLGYFYLVPIDLDAADSLPFKDKMLNFRFQHSAKADVQTTVKKFTFGLTATYISFMQNIGTFEGINNIGTYREANNTGEFVLDARLGFNFTDEAQLSFIAKNLTGNQYTLRPGYFEAPRNYTVQVSYQF